ncbi:hypothetical protein D9619_012974 [Psilocybe cf. subviscida]|uniref:Uncharacterized protein n=1 Tax=Psilocybe cf. subviscida TaxID=2480587 RepID=A0A8H5BIK1_9AGAR|nr:hypothetical protein D9619_012974 [Psilocybe cf. subviscida]
MHPLSYTHRRGVLERRQVLPSGNDFANLAPSQMADRMTPISLQVSPPRTSARSLEFDFRCGVDAHAGHGSDSDEDRVDEVGLHPVMD